MNWQRIKKLILVFVAAFLVIMITGVAVAQRDSEIQIFKMGTDVTVQEKQVMTDVVAIGGNVTILNEGQVTQDAVAIGGDVILKSNARIGGDAVAIGGQIIKEPGAMIGGDEVVIFSNAGVLLDRFGLVGMTYLVNTAFSLIFLTVIFAFGMFLLFLLPGHLQIITATMHQHSFKSGVLGMLVLALISLIPIVGGLIIIMLDLFGLGAVLLSRVGTLQPETIKSRFDQLESLTQPSEG
ncbi:MAG: hypothetical protein HC764_25020 [Pleurocapsa sp. CRU_1_2]|nr:hypothetical protein [Pleurocapsa sp. CRU_1_2]